MIDYAALIDWISCAIPFLVFFGFVWAPKTWTPGELVTAASMNTNIRDHLNETLRSQTSASTGLQNNFALDGPFAYVKLNNASALVITGALIDSGNIDGARVIFEAINLPVTLSHQSSSSSSSNRFINDTGGDIVLGTTERAFLFYDTANTRWRVGKASTGAIAQTLGAKNLHPDPYILFWAAGDAAAPSGSTLAKDGNSALARNTTTYKFGGMAPQLKLGTTATISTSVRWPIFSSLPVSWRGKTIGYGAWLYTATAGLGQIWIADGGTDGTTYSNPHSGGGGWEWISGTHTITGDATELSIYVASVISGQGASEVWTIFDGKTITKGPSAPTDTVAPITVEGLLYPGVIKGNAAVATRVFDFDARQPFIVLNTSLRVITAPTGAALIVDVNHWDGSIFQSMHSTKPQIAATAFNGGADPDGTYRYRCFDGRKNAESITDCILTADVDQIGSTVKGEDLQIMIAVMQFQDQVAAEK